MPRGCALRREPDFNLLRRNQFALIGGALGDFDLVAEPGIVRRRFLLLYERAHEVTQKLRPGTVAGFRGFGKLLFQGLIHAEGEGRFSHGFAIMCYAVGAR